MQHQQSIEQGPGSGKAIVVGVDFGQQYFSASLEECLLLSETAGATVVEVITAKRSSPDAAHYVGSGKAEEIALSVSVHQPELVIFNHVLSPAQQRNLEAVLKVRVLDRTGLILDIFAQRAQSHEGKLQVELAQLQYLSTRLVRLWTHLERQKGGIGLRGPGETQIEADRQIIGDKVKAVRARLDKLTKQRSTRRRARMRSGQFTVSIVGYTNAGKSSLFNTLTSAKAYCADQLFATLDTTSRRVYLPDVGNVIVSDTVGFIRDLPHGLIEAFKATLEETIFADVLLHVIDVSSEDRDQKVHEVNFVLNEIEAASIRQLLVLNKIDLVPDLPARIERDEAGLPTAVYVSAFTGEGFDLLRQALSELAVTYAGRIHQQDTRVLEDWEIALLDEKTRPNNDVSEG